MYVKNSWLVLDDNQGNNRCSKFPTCTLSLKGLNIYSTTESSWRNHSHNCHTKMVNVKSSLMKGINVQPYSTGWTYPVGLKTVRRYMCVSPPILQYSLLGSHFWNVSGLPWACLGPKFTKLSHIQKLYLFENGTVAVSNSVCKFAQFLRSMKLNVIVSMKTSSVY